MKAFSHLGFMCLQFDFVQPPLEETKAPCYNLLLTLLVDEATPRRPNPPYSPYLPTPLLKKFLSNYWEDCCGPQYFTKQAYQDMMKQLQDKDVIELVDCMSKCTVKKRLESKL